MENWNSLRYTTSILTQLQFDTTLRKIQQRLQVEELEFRKSLAFRKGVKDASHEDEIWHKCSSSHGLSSETIIRDHHQRKTDNNICFMQFDWKILIFPTRIHATRKSPPTKVFILLSRDCVMSKWQSFYEGDLHRLFFKKGVCKCSQSVFFCFRKWC